MKRSQWPEAVEGSARGVDAIDDVEVGAGFAGAEVQIAGAASRCEGVARDSVQVSVGGWQDRT